MLPPHLTGISTGLQERMIEFKGHLQEASKLFSEMLKEVFGLGGFFPRVNKENHVEFFGHVGFLYGSPVLSRVVD